MQLAHELVTTSALLQEAYVTIHRLEDAVAAAQQAAADAQQQAELMGTLMSLWQQAAVPAQPADEYVPA